MIFFLDIKYSYNRLLREMRNSFVNLLIQRALEINLENKLSYSKIIISIQKIEQIINKRQNIK